MFAVVSARVHRLFVPHWTARWWAVLALGGAAGTSRAESAVPGVPPLATANAPAATPEPAEKPAPAADDEATAEGTPDVGEGERLFWRAADAYRAGEYARAIELFEASFRHTSDHRALFNIAQCHRKLRDCDSARSAFARYAGTQTTVDERASEWLEGLDRECPTPGAPAQAPALETVADLDAAVRQLHMPEALDLPEPVGVAGPPAADPPAAESGSGRAIAAWSLVAGGGAAMVASTLFAFEAQATRRELEEETQGLVEGDLRWEDSPGPALEEELSRQQSLAWGLGMGGAVAAGIGAVLLLTMDDAPNTGHRLDVVIAPNGLSTHWSSRF